MQIFRVKWKVTDNSVNHTAEYEEFFSTRQKANKAIDEYIEQERANCEKIKDNEFGRMPTRIVKIWFPNNAYQIVITRDLIEVQ